MSKRKRELKKEKYFCKIFKEKKNDIKHVAIEYLSVRERFSTFFFYIIHTAIFFFDSCMASAKYAFIGLKHTRKVDQVAWKRKITWGDNKDGEKERLSKRVKNKIKRNQLKNTEKVRNMIGRAKMLKNFSLTFWITCNSKSIQNDFNQTEYRISHVSRYKIIFISLDIRRMEWCILLNFNSRDVLELMF